MKKTIILGCLLLAGALIVSCKKSNLNYESDFNKSYREWLSFKAASGNSYRYMVQGASWIGYGWKTVISITGGQVRQRYFKLTPTPGSSINIPTGDMEWTENANEINTHPKSQAAAAITLDQVYEKARTEWLVKRKNTTTYFETKNQGMISSCGYVNDGCQDDCFIGINIGYIQIL